MLDDTADTAQILDVALDLLAREYVFPGKAAEVDAAVRRALAAGEFDGLDDEALCRVVTEVLFAASGDKHLRLLWSDEPQDAESEDGDARWAALSLSRNHGLRGVRILEGNVGLVDTTLVSAPQDGAELIASALRLVANTRSLILDLRDNIGGSPDGVQLWCSYFFKDNDVHLNDVYTRKTDSTRQYWTLAHVAGPRYLDRPVYVLTGPKTFSGAEELAYNLKVNKRATLVGETTRGGAHPTAWYPITRHHTFTVPQSRSINPVTGTNWEGVGIEPDVPAAVADAFDVAYRLAAQAAS